MRQFIYQESKKGCGLACLRMAMVEATGDKNYKYLRLEKHPPYNLKELQGIVEKEGGKLTFSKANSKDCIEEALSFPCLLLLKSEESEHMVYVPKRTKTKFLVFDPEFGPSWIKIEELKEKWTLISGTIEMFNVKKSPYVKPKIRSLSSLVLPTILTIFSFACIYGAFYFMQDNSNYLISIGLLTAYGILEIISRFLMISSMKKFDDRWMNSIISKRKYLKERYIHYHSLKKTLYPDILTLVNSIVFAISIVILFSFNNSMFLISVACVIAYVSISVFAFKKSISTKKSTLEKLESSLFKDNLTNEEALTALEDVNKESYRIGKALGYEKIVYVITIIMAALIPLTTTENITLNYYLLHFGALFAFGEAIRNLFEFVTNKENREREVMYFYEYFYKE